MANDGELPGRREAMDRFRSRLERHELAVQREASQDGRERDRKAGEALDRIARETTLREDRRYRGRP